MVAPTVGQGWSSAPRVPAVRPKAVAVHRVRHDTQFGHTIVQACAVAGQAVDFFRPVLDEYPDLDPSSGIFIEGIDFSPSTIGDVGNALAPALMDGRRAVLAQGLNGLHWGFGFHDVPFSLRPDQPLSTLEHAPEIRVSDFSSGGFANGRSTNACLAIVIAVGLGVAHRERGHTGKITVSIWTDGCDMQRVGSANRDRCRRALRLARKHDVKVEIRGFCPAESWGRYVEWKNEVKLQDEESFVAKLEHGANVEDVVSRSVDGHTQSMGGTMMFRTSDTPPAVA